jgi:hypothetical protein
MAAKIPDNVKKYLWDVTEETLSVNKHKNFIIERVLEYGDFDSLKWLTSTYSKSDIVKVLKTSNKISRNTGNLYALYFDVDKEEILCIQKPFIQKTKQVLDKIKNLPILTNFYLAGGTALSLQLGHRKSVDLDFFSRDFPKRDLILQEFDGFKPKIIQEAPGTLDMLIDDVVVTLLEYKYPLIDDLAEFDGVKMASIADIASMKLSAISSRGSKKDFVDLYMILQKISLAEILTKFEKKYEKVEYQKTHILKSLLTFDLANEDPDPDYLEKIEWKNVKMSLERDVKNYLDLLQGE